MQLSAISTLTIRAKPEGIDETSAKLKVLGSAVEGVAVASDKSSKAQLSAQAALERQQRSLDAAYRSAQSYAKVVGDLERAHSQGLTTLARHNELMALAAERYGRASGFGYAFQKSLQGIQGQLIALSAGAGPVGTFLAALGPWGVAAAIGLGGTEKILSGVSSAAHEFAQKATELRNTAESIGLTATQLKALERVGASVGVSSDRISAGFEGLTSHLEEFRAGQGRAYEILTKYNAGLADQLASTRSTAGAIDVLSRAFQKLDVTQRAALGRELGFGRAPGDLIRLLSGVGAAGGLDAATGSFGKGIDENLINRMRDLNIQIEQTSKEAHNNIAKIFAPDVLEAELAYYKIMVQITGAIADAVKWGRELLGGSASPVTRPSIDVSKAPSGPDPYAAQRAFNDTKRWMDILGPAATSTQILQLRQLELNAAVEKAGGSYKRYADAAMHAYEIQQHGADLQTRISLGIADAEQIRRQRNDELGLQLRRIGATEAERTRAIDAGRIATQKYVEETQRRMEVDRAALPGLKALELESGNLRIQIDNIAVTSLNNLTTSLADITMGTARAGDAFRNLGLQVVRSLEEMIIKMLIITPIAKGLQGLLGGFLPGGGAVAAGASAPIGIVGSAGPLVVPTVHTGGVLGADTLVGRYVHPSYFDDAPRYHSGGLAGDEVAAILRRGEGVFTSGQMAAIGRGMGETSITVHAPVIVNTGGGPAPGPAHQIQMGQAVHKQVRQAVHAEIMEQKRQGGLLNPRS